MSDLNQQPALSKEEIDSVVTLYSNGHYLEAVDKIKTLNEKYPNVPLLFNIIGSCYKALGYLEASVQMYKTAVHIKPDYAEAHKNLGITYKDLGQLNDAVKSFKKAISIQPDYIDAYYNLAITHKAFNKLNASAKIYKKIISVNPNFSEAHNNLGNIFEELDKTSDAIKSYKMAIVINPNFAEAHNNLGNAFKDLEWFEDALKSYEKAISIKPNFSEAYYNSGLVFERLRRHEDAVLAYQNAITIKPDFAEAYNNLGSCFTVLGRMDEAIDCLKKAISIKPDNEEANKNLGFNLFSLGKIKESAKFFEKAIAINPNYAEAHKNLGNVFKKVKQLDNAMLCYERAYELKPNMAFILGDVLNNKMNLCDWGDLPNLLNKAKIEIMNSKEVVGPFSLLGLVDDPALQRKASENFANFYYPKNNILSKIGCYPKHKKIRVGYFSADFKVHPVATLTVGLYERHDRSYFEIYAFSLGPDTKDEMNLRIKAGVDHFHNVRSMSHKEIALLARSLEIDIAIDLAGLTAESRTDVFAMSVAPIQLSYIGFLGTMGTDYYDYLIADQVMIPQEYQQHYAEKIAYLPNFQVNDSTETLPDAILTRKDLKLPEEGFVFCCFNNTYKFTPTVFDSWARILKSVEGSVLIVFVNNELSKKNLTNEIVERGVDSDRLIFGDSLARPEYLDRYRSADLFLDTTPYNAGTTASDALRMGLPVLTCIGESYQARMGASILTAMNLPELITRTSKEYESLAIELATDPDKYKIIKDKLVRNLSTAPLYDTLLFTKNIESAYTTMYERHHQGLEPDHIYIQHSN